MNRAAQRLGHPASIPRAIMSRSPEALAFGSRRHFIPASLSLPLCGCLLNRSRDCSRSRVPPRFPRRRYADAPAAASLVVSPLDEFLALCDSFIARLRGAAPRARQGEAPASAGADPDGLPGLPRFPRSLTFEIPGTRLCRPALRAALLGRAIPLRPGRPGTSWRM
jgi:hypothetical protein